MDLSASEYNRSSASESGWTHYLDQSSLWENYLERSGGILEHERKGARMKEEQEEDLSMVSDASSGPPHYHDEVDKCFSENWYPHHSSTSQSKKKVKGCGRNPHLDDTASSPVHSYPKKNGAVDFSQGFSAAKLKVKPKFQKHFNFFECSLAGKQASEESGGFDEEERK
ncbi:uncharacterized protein G2W53_031400 [Senna tora]|uniref:Uncharacterized protein n=1 Tax=Senna tora TaxID=362788 RepID=A0A834WFI4_9FABA|nr:uncharacterized protein G2W53_031400 [Senna tora]